MSSVKELINRADVTELALTVPGLMKLEELGFLYDTAMQATVGEYIVELGTYLGRTLTVLAYVSLVTHKKLISIDNYSYDARCSLGKVRANLISVGVGKQLDKGSIVLLNEDSRQRPDSVTNIGLLFVDSLHTRQHFDAEMTAWLGHVEIGGVIICHDYDSPTYLEMTGAIDHWLRTKRYQFLGTARRLIAFRKLM